MRLTEANKKLNREFHKLDSEERKEFLLKACSEVTNPANPRDPFYPLKLKPKEIEREIGKNWRSEVGRRANKINNLNFLLNRINMEHNQDYELMIRDLCLLKWEQTFMTDNDVTFNPQLIADFFEKRGKPEYIAPIFKQMGDKATGYDFIAREVIDHPAFKKYVGENETRVFKLRTELHNLVNNEQYDKEQTASALIDKGFDLQELDFNKWYSFDTNFSLKCRDKRYKKNEKEEEWLKSFIEQKKQGLVLKEPKKLRGDDEDPMPKLKESLENLVRADKGIKYTLQKLGNRAEYWVTVFSPLVSDHDKLNIDFSNQVQASIWEYIYSGDFVEMGKWMKGANPHGRTRKGLNYVKWALKHPEHSKTLDKILAEDALSIVIAGDILVYDPDSAIENYKDPELQKYKNPDKLKAAINLAFEALQNPGEDDEKEGYKPPRAYCFEVVKEFEEFLKDAPKAQPYLRLIHANKETKLEKEETEILDSLASLEAIEDVCEQVGLEDTIKDRYIKVFNQVFKRDTEYASLFTEIGGILSLVQNEAFRRYVSDEEIKTTLNKAVEKAMKRKSRYGGEKHGVKKLTATIYHNPILRPYLDGNINLPKIVEGMIDEAIGWRGKELIEKPLSLMSQGDFHMGSSEILETYVLADKYRNEIKPEKMQDLVAYLFASVTDERGGSFDLTSLLIDEKAQVENLEYVKPDYLPDPRENKETTKIEFLSRIYEKEKKSGGLDRKKAETAFQNVIYRGNFVQPERFYPHLDTMLQIINSPLRELLPNNGPVADAIKEYVILNDFIKQNA
ncbi:MAG: hypothetical protein Q8N63_08870 [Nanoarchaeota archaeon]|nr:hypothetical protein [Nanoarchaeota archaeon]